MAIWIYIVRSIRIDISIHTCKHIGVYFGNTVIQADGYTASRVTISMLISSRCPQYIGSHFPPASPLQSALWYTPLFLFCNEQVVFLYVRLSYLDPVPTKTQLAPKQPGSGGAGLYQGRKKVATPIFSGMTPIAAVKWQNHP